MIDDETEVRDLEARMHLAMEGLRKAVLRLLQDGQVHPQLVTLAVARIAGELGAGIAQAGDMDLETVLAEVTEVVRKAGRSGPSLTDGTHLRRLAPRHLAPRHPGHGGGNQALDPIQ